MVNFYSLVVEVVAMDRRENKGIAANDKVLRNNFVLETV